MMGVVRSYLLCAFALLAVRVEGQDQIDPPFFWGFTTNTNTELIECQTYAIMMYPHDGSTLVGVAPYYLIAFKPGGIPTTTMIGSDPNNLSWAVDHAQGATLMLTVVDSTGVSAGVDSVLRTVTSGSDTSCIPPLPSSAPASVQANVTDPNTLMTCQPWGLTIQNSGTKSATVVLSALNSPVITNVSMLNDNDVLTYINRAEPNGQLMASIVDDSGQWGISSSIIHTTGSTDYTCPGLETSQSSTQSQPQTTSAPALPQTPSVPAQPQTPSVPAQPQTPSVPNKPQTPSAHNEPQTSQHAAQLEADAKKRRHTHLIVGLIVGFGVPTILLGLAVIMWFCCRRRPEVWQEQRPEIEQDLWDNPDTNARPVPYSDHTGAIGDMQEIDAPPFPAKDPLYAVDNTEYPQTEVIPVPSVYFDQGSMHAQQWAGRSDFSAVATMPYPATVPYPVTMPHPVTMPYPMSLNASHGRSMSLSNPSIHASVTLSQNQIGSPSASLQHPDSHHGIVVQHRDGGFVDEVPPPYAGGYVEAAASTTVPPALIAPAETVPTSGFSMSNVDS